MVLSLGAPLFMLLSTELYPRHLTLGGFFLAWLLLAVGLLALLLLAVPPASGTSSSGPPSSAVAVAVAVHATASPLGGGAAASGGGGSGGALGRLWPAGGRLWQRLGARRQRRNVLLALVASVQCMLWMSVAADELVALFQVRV